MKRIALIIVSIVLLSINSEGQKQAFRGDQFVCNFETTHGLLNGDYVSYYKNGQKKAEGKYLNNCRKGIWTVWDSTGRLRMKRDYENILCFKRIIPATPDDKSIALLNTPKYSLQYNKDGYIQYSDVKERMVSWSSRIWRLISPQDNPLLFDNDKLFDILTKYIQDNKNSVYKDEEFTKTIQLSFYNPPTFKVVAYKIKEDMFIDNDRLVAEERILGICPVVIYNGTNASVDLGWIYFPDLRKTLAQEKINIKDVASDIKSYDDLFFFRYFYGQIIKQSNVYDRPIAKYKSSKEEIDKEALSIEMSLIDVEHDFWISLTK